MDSARLISSARRRAGLTLRDLAARAATSHSTLAAYEAGRKVPTADTLSRVLRAAGFAIDVELRLRHSTDARGAFDREQRSQELAEVLHLAEQFPARHAPTLGLPVFGATAQR